MATKVFPRNALGDIGFMPSPEAWMASAATSNMLFGSASQGSASPSHASVASTVAGPATRYWYAILSPPLSADITISGTVTLNVRTAENSMSANVGARVEVYRLAALTGTIGSQLLTTPNRGVESGTSEAAANWTSAITSTDMIAGDRMLIVFGWTDTGGTQASGFTTTIWDDGAAGATGDTWVQFTENLTFDSGTPAGTTLYFTSTASDISTADVDLKADFVRGSGVVNITRAPGAGPLSPTAYQSGGTNVRWYTPQLSAVTLSGFVTCNLRAKSSGSNSAGISIQLLKRTSGGTETDIGWATWNNTGGSSSALSTVEAALSIPLTISGSVSLSDGDRLGIIVHTDDAQSFTHTTTTETFYYNGTSGGASGDSFITLSQTVTEFVAAAAKTPFRNKYPQLLAH